MYRYYKLKFESHEQAKSVFESVREFIISDIAIVDYNGFEYDAILSEASELLTPYEVFPEIPKHDWL
jgi:hypothetical protein